MRQVTCNRKIVVRRVDRGYGECDIFIGIEAVAFNRFRLDLVGKDFCCFARARFPAVPDDWNANTGGRQERGDAFNNFSTAITERALRVGFFLNCLAVLHKV